MFTNSSAYIREDDKISIRQNSATADRTAIEFRSETLNGGEVRVDMEDTRLAELRTRIGAYLADKYGDADMGRVAGGIEWTPVELLPCNCPADVVADEGHQTGCEES